MPGQCLVVQMKRLKQAALLARRQIAPFADPEPLNRDRPDPRPPQPFHLDPGDLHDPTHEVVNPLVDRDREDNAVQRLPEQPHLLRHDPSTLDHDSGPDSGKLLRRRPNLGQDVVLLGQPVARMHHPVGDVPVIGEEQQPFGLTVQPTDREDALGDVDQVHHGPAAALVVHRRDVAGRLVQDQVAERLRWQELAINPNLVPDRVRFRPQLGDDRAIHRNSALADQFLGGAARSDPARREDAL